VSGSMQDIDDVIGSYQGRQRRVLEYSQLMAAKVLEAKKPGFSQESWTPLEALVDKEKFERVGNFKEIMDYTSYIAFLTQWATTSDWECSFKGIWEQGDRIFLELEERSSTGGYSSAVNSLSVYVFNNKDKIEHVDIFLQMEMPDPEILRNYEGVV